MAVTTAEALTVCAIAAFPAELPPTVVATGACWAKAGSANRHIASNGVVIELRIVLSPWVE
jgi:hypothetical protein